MGMTFVISISDIRFVILMTFVTITNVSFFVPSTQEAYDGQIFFMGNEMKFKNIKESEKAGIAIIHQELTMIPELSVTENIFMGNEITKTWTYRLGQRKKTDQ